MTKLPKPLRLGTRASPLAIAQAQLVRAALCAAHCWDETAISLHPVTASGDRILDRALADVGGKALWTKELDAQLAEGEIDFAVHAMKDVETNRPESFVIAAMLPRADVRDRLIGAASISELASGARVGTSAPRRTAQILRLRPDLVVTLFRGNVATRLAKLTAGEADATLLAAAGLDRLGLANVGAAISTEIMLPAPQQGAIGIECLAANEKLVSDLNAIDDQTTHQCVDAERALLLALSGDCRSPVAALARMQGQHIHLRAEIYSADGRDCASGEAFIAPGDATGPADLAQRLIRDASPAIRAVFA
jgi:hydroxymethylbilane synthase